jgi:hypothetical protein
MKDEPDKHVVVGRSKLSEVVGRSLDIRIDGMKDGEGGISESYLPETTLQFISQLFHSLSPPEHV